MLNKFKDYLIARGYKEFSANGSRSTSWDYPVRIQHIIENEKITLEELSNNIQRYMDLYKRNGERWSFSKRSHESYLNALRQFQKFVLISRFGPIAR